MARTKKVNGSSSASTAPLGIGADLMDCLVALHGQLFYSTQVLACLWFFTKNKNADAKRGLRDRRQQTLSIDARAKHGSAVTRNPFSGN